MGKLSVFSMFLISHVLVAHFTTVLKTYAESEDDESCDFPAIFNFGDGLSDTGNFASVFYGRPPYYGQSYFGEDVGRGSDGRLIIDFYASSLGLPFLHGYLDSLGADFSHGANFANVLSTIALPRKVVPVTAIPRGLNPIYFDLQIAQFAQFVNRSQALRQQGGVFENLMPKKEYFAKALYTIDIGLIDISQELLDFKTSAQVRAIVPGLIQKFSANVQILYSLGARSFWIHNTGPIGCLPYMLTMAPVSDEKLDSAGCAKPYNELCQYFNSQLKKGVDQLQKDLPSASFTYVDVYSVKYSLFQQPERFGFKHPHESCCGYGGKYNFGENSYNCGTQATAPNGTQFIVQPCENPSEYISYDGLAYTEAADKITSGKISSGKYSDPPNSLKHACRHK